jgi:hypothetical protein
MLFTDQLPLTATELRILEPGISKIERLEGVVLDVAVSLTIAEIGNQLISDFQSFAYQWTVTGILDSLGGDNTPAPRISLNQVVMDGPTTYNSPLKNVLLFTGLRNFYQSVSHRSVEADDRYARRRDAIQSDLEMKYWPALKSSGLPIVGNPLTAPAAIGIQDSGTWTSDNVQALSGTATGGSFDVSVSWIRVDGTESAPSATVTFVVPPSNVMVVDISTLNIPSSASSWKIYSGIEDGKQYFQASLPTSTSSHTFPSDPLLSGPGPSRGQAADKNLVFENLWIRS